MLLIIHWCCLQWNTLWGKVKSKSKRLPVEWSTKLHTHMKIWVCPKAYQADWWVIRPGASFLPLAIQVKFLKLSAPFLQCNLLNRQASFLAHQCQFDHYELSIGFGKVPWSDGEESICNAGDPGFSPWVRKIPWRREWPLQYSCLENSMDWLQSMVSQRVRRDWVTNIFTFKLWKAQETALVTAYFPWIIKSLTSNPESCVF